MAIRSQSQFRLQNATLHPPALSPDDDGAEIPWVLLDKRAYVAERCNATTAFSTTWDGKEIQVTFCLALPPQVSYICVFCPGLEHTEFPLEPKILAMEEDIVLLRIIVSSKKDILKDIDYYIYRAADRAAGGGPSLTRLERPPSPYCFDSHQVGILRCGTNRQPRHHDQSKFILRPHHDTTDDFYVVAGLCKVFVAQPGQFVLCLYNSKLPGRWSTNCVSLDEQQLLQYGFLRHDNSKVIAIGGDAGTMGFVDLWRGILFCDVLPAEGKPIPPLRYVKLPPPFQPSEYSDDARLTRDIAVVQEGRMIKYVALQLHWKPCPGFKDHYVVDGWVSRAWNRPVAASYLEDCWDLDCTCKSSAITVDSNQHFELLPKVLDNGGTPLPPFNKLVLCQPTLSLHDNDGIVYFMTKKNRWDHKAWVIAVDMRKNTLRGVAEFSAERFVGMNFAYVHSRISKFLLRVPDTMKDLKRSGTELLGSSVKKHAGFWMTMPPWDLGQKKHDSEMEGDGDDMV